MSSNKEYAVKLENATVRYNLSKERVDTLKELVIRKAKGKLHYNEFFPVRDVSLTIKPGEAWGIVGRNGAGKSTLLRLICGILTPFRGSVSVDGNISPLIELGAGFENELTGRENIFLNGTMLGHSLRYMKEHYDEIVDFADIGEFIDVPLKNYSSGMRARLGFAIATSVEPEILVVDEILSVGDLEFQKKCQKRMNTMIGGGTTLIFVSHSDAMVKRLCTNAIWLDHGRCVYQGSADSVVDAYVAGKMLNNREQGLQ